MHSLSHLYPHSLSINILRYTNRQNKLFKCIHMSYLILSTYHSNIKFLKNSKLSFYQYYDKKKIKQIPHCIALHADIPQLPTTILQPNPPQSKTTSSPQTHIGFTLYISTHIPSWWSRSQSSGTGSPAPGRPNKSLSSVARPCFCRQSSILGGFRYCRFRSDRNRRDVSQGRVGSGENQTHLISKVWS